MFTYQINSYIDVLALNFMQGGDIGSFSFFHCDNISFFQ